MIPSSLLPVANHLWQSTLFAAIAGLLTLLLRDNRAHTRYCLWLAASVKFLVPFSLLVFVGSQFGRHTAIAPVPSRLPVMIERVNEPFGTEVSLKPATASHPPQSARLVVPILVGVWAGGFGILTFSLWMRWRRLQATLRAALPINLAGQDIGVRVLSSAWFIEPGVVGVFRPVLMLPDGIAAELAPAELQAVLAHEMTHVRRRDNLATAIHMVVETVFWFHPLVWWLGARLIEERELACDEEVLRSGSNPGTYAEGILKICELYLHSPLKCMAGATGASLKKRIEAIMDNRSTLNLSFAKKAGLAIAGVLAVAIPVILGVTNAPLLRAQTESKQVDPSLRFEVASVRRVEIPLTANGGVPVSLPTGGIGTSDPHRYAWHGAWLMNLITEAFGVRSDQISGPGWPSTERYDIIANIPDGATKEQFSVMMGNLLRDRFHLRLHMDSKVRSVYALRVGKNGPKFKETPPVPDTAAAPSNGAGGIDAQGFIIMPPGRKGILMMPRPGEMFMTAKEVLMAEFAQAIESRAGRPVVDETGLTGHYDFKIHFEWMVGRGGDPNAPSPAPSIFTAVEEQLGLKLESASKSYPQLIIDSIDKEPTEN